MHILMLSATFPYPPSRGGTHNRTFHLLQGLRNGNPAPEITLVTQGDPGVSPDDRAALGQWVQHLQVFPAPAPAGGTPWAKVRRLGQFLTQGTPAHVLYRYDPQIQAWVDDWVERHGTEGAAVTCEHSVNEIYIQPAWRSRYPRLRTVLNVHSSLYSTAAQQLALGLAEKPERDRLLLPLLYRYERRSAAKFQNIVVTTEDDRQQFAQFAPPGSLDWVANGVDLAQFPYRSQDPGGQQLVFVGGLDYFVNIDAAVRLCREILPPLADRYPQITVTLVGANPAPSVRALADDRRVTVTGRVPTVVDFLHQGTVFVAPLRLGFGMKLKTLEALAAGIPVVGSDRGLEGIQGLDDWASPAALRANSIPETIAAIGQLLDDPPLRQALSQRGRHLVESQYTWTALGQKYFNLVTAPF